MKILYTTDQVYRHGGIEKVLAQKANWFAAQPDTEVIILTHSQKQFAPVYNFNEKIKFQDIGINYADGVSFFSPQNLKKTSLHFKKLKEALRSIKPDVVISCSFGPDFYFLPFAEPGIPKIKEFHSSRYLHFNKKTKGRKEKILDFLSKQAEKRYDSIVVLNPDEVQFYNSEKISVIPNPAESTNYRSDSTQKKVMTAGRISPVKNFGELVEIWKMISPEFADWELHFYGEDYLGTQAKIQKQIDEAGLQRSVKFMGVSKNLSNTMQDYSIYAMTSETECFPMVLLEALSAGMPVVVYDVPTGPKHIVTNNSDGLIVANKDLTIFAEALTTLMSNQIIRKEFGESGVANMNRFEITNIMGKWILLIKNLRGAKTEKRD